MRGVQLLSAALAAGLFMPACGGGGGSDAQQILSLQSISVLVVISEFGRRVFESGTAGPTTATATPSSF